MVAAEEAAKHVGEYKVAIASGHEAREKQAIDKADLDLAVQTLDEHTIKRPLRRDHHQADEGPRRERPGE